MARAPITVRLTGFNKFMKTMGDARQSVLPIAKEVLYSEAQAILRESRMEVPFLRGLLSASGRVHEPVIYGNKALVAGRYLMPLTSVYVKQDDALETKVVKAKAVRPVGAIKEA